MDLLAALQSTTRFARLHHMSVCASTQLRSMADEGEDSAVYWADHQTDGRGRQGRTWHDAAAQDVTATFRLAGVGLDNPTLLAAAAPVAVARAVAGIVPEVRIKWPNDLLLGGRKLCGILIDTDTRLSQTFHVGVGINVNRASFPAELLDRSTSLALATGRESDRESILLALAQAISAATDAIVSGDLDSMAEEFRRRLGLLGRRVSARTGNAELHGTLADLDLQDATLEVDGEVRRIPLAHLQALSPR